MSLEEKPSFNPIEAIKANTKCKFSRAGALCNKYKAISFGKGSPSFGVAEILKKSSLLAFEDIESLENPAALSNKFLLEQMAIEKSLLTQRSLNPTENVMVNIGACGVLTAYIYSHLKLGDEVILFEPFFIWNRAFEIKGITCKYAKPLYNEETGGYGEIDFKNIESLISEKTKLILIINPNNPDGRVWLRSELEQLAEIVKKHSQVNVFSDEVYCRNIYDETQFIPFCTIPEMFERTVSNYSFGKEFLCTGWRIGGASGPAHLIKPMVEYTKSSVDGNMFLEFALGHAFQLAREPYQGYLTYYEWMKADFQKRKDAIIEILETTKKFEFGVVNPMGGYTIVADIKKSIKMVPMKYYYPESGIPEEEKREFINSIEEWMTLINPDLTTDEAFSEYMTIEHGVSTVPGCAFYKFRPDCIQEQLGKSFIRFSICKSDEEIHQLKDKII